MVSRQSSAGARGVLGHRALASRIKLSSSSVGTSTVSRCGIIRMTNRKGERENRTDGPRGEINKKNVVAT